MPDKEEKEQRVRERAYQIWLDEGQPAGRDREHWRKAEAEVNAETGAPDNASDQSNGSEPPIAGPYENIG
jgi:hypothetical protein